MKRNLRKEYADILRYIDKYWDKVTRFQPKDDFPNGIIGLPKPFLTPNKNRFSVMFNWDSYFIAQGILETKRHKLAKNMAENLAYLYRRFGIIPNAATTFFLGSSQPPLLSSLVMDVYGVFKDKKWLSKYIKAAHNEYLRVWVSENDKFGHFHHRIRDYLLSRYGDRDAGYLWNAERESGWDFSVSRFANRADNFLPIDLNCLLYKAEKDFEKAAIIFKKKKEANYWNKKSRIRKKEINKYLWNEPEGFFFDYDYIHKRLSRAFTLAGFFPMWSGLASRQQARRMIKKIFKFETNCGLTISSEDSLPPTVNIEYIPRRFRLSIEESLKPKQWDWPNIWPPLEYLTVSGLLRYGYTLEAKRIMLKSIAAQAAIFRKYKTFYEKINGITGDKSGSYHYQEQSGFGWTNAVFSKYISLLEKI